MDDVTTRRLYHSLVGGRSGVVRHLNVVPPVADGPEIVTAGCEAVVRAPRGERHALASGGAGRTRAQAVTRCLGEAVERYCASFVDDDVFVATSGSLTDETIDVETLTLFADWQYAQSGFPFAPLGPDTALSWTRVYSKTAGREKLVPSFLVYLTEEPPGEAALVAPSVSTGLACHRSPAEAALAAVLECIERDAFTCTWMARLAPPRVVVDEGDIDPDWLPFGGECTLFDITSDTAVPAALIFLRGRSQAGSTNVIGTAAAPTWRQARDRAALEAAMAWGYAVWLTEREPRWSPGPRFENVVSFPHHARLYTGRPALASAFDFLFTEEEEEERRVEEATTSEPVETLERVVQSLASVGVEVLLRDLTTPDVSELGLSVVRAVCPGLQPLHGHHHLPFLGPGRLWNVKDHFACARENPTRRTLNPWPHPSG